jgi:DNA (cytosine-5)-methyltransferase 1
MTFGSLFSGIGGFDLGFERAGMTCKWQVEIDPYASQVLAKHWPDVSRYKDVKKFCRRLYDCDIEDENSECLCPRCNTDFGECECVGTDQLIDECGSVDVICGGFPCQDISNAGKMAGITGDRSGLFFEIIRIARELGPRYIVLENVASLLGRGMGRVLGELSAIGFDAEWHCIPASHVGAPHRRDRIWIIAYPHGMRLQRGEHEREAERIETLFKAKSWGNLPASRVCRGDDGISRRVDRLKCLGNSIVPQVAEIVGRRVFQIERSLTPLLEAIK